MQTYADASVLSGFGRNDVQVLSGTFDDFTFVEVVQVMGLSRQCLRFLIKQGGSVWSEILVKAGRVLSARAGNAGDPQVVFQTIATTAVRGSGLAFALFHIEPTGPFPSPVGELQALTEATQNLRAAGAQGVDNKAQPTNPSTGTLAASALGPRTDGGTLIMARATHATPMGTSVTPTPTVDSKVLAHEQAQAIAAALMPKLDQIAGQLHTLEGRIGSLAQVINAETRLALSQQAAAQAAAQLPSSVPQAPVMPPAAPPVSDGHSPGSIPKWAIGLAIALPSLLCVLLVIAILMRVR